MPETKTGVPDFISAVCAAALGFSLLMHSAEVSKGMSDGLLLCAKVLIPSLFPFMTLACWLSLTNAAQILSLPLGILTTKVFRLPRETGAIVLLSFIGGYPVGAKSISLLLSQKKIDRKTATRMMCFCMNAGPPFVISAVGAGMLGDRNAGIALLAGQLFAGVAVGMVAARGAKLPGLGAGTAKPLRGTEAFVSAVSSSSSAMLGMCAYATLFSGLLPLVAKSGLIPAAAAVFEVREELLRAAAGGMFEVATGCAAAAGLGGEAGFILASVCLSFGGLSVWLQIMSYFREGKINFIKPMLMRFLHMPAALCVSLPLYRRFCEAQTVFAPADPPAVKTDARGMLITCCLLSMCVILTMDHCKTGKDSVK